MGIGNDPRYQNDRTFDPFPFPAPLTDPAADTTHLAALGERLDAFRKERLAAAPELTMTKLYNALERYREASHGGAPLDDEERAVHEAGLVSVLAEIHDEIDRAALAAYGWSDLAPDLVGRPGGTTPSSLKSEAQVAAEEELLARLVALNGERAAEEARGHVRWLRPDYQVPKLGHKVRGAGEQGEADVSAPILMEAPAWPTAIPEQVAALRSVLAQTPAPAAPAALSKLFRGRNTAQRKARVAELLDTLATMGAARRSDDGARYFAGR